MISPVTRLQFGVKRDPDLTSFLLSFSSQQIFSRS